jgi:hypothetical protein
MTSNPGAIDFDQPRGTDSTFRWQKTKRKLEGNVITHYVLRYMLFGVSPSNDSFQLLHTVKEEISLLIFIGDLH